MAASFSLAPSPGRFPNSSPTCPWADSARWASQRIKSWAFAGPSRCSLASSSSLNERVGGIVLGLVEPFVGASDYSTYRDAIAFAVLILILLFKPAGLFGKATVEKV